MNRNPYEIFKVSQNASWSEIKSAYRKLVKIHHPDTGGDQNIMLEINAAWEKLKVKNEIPYSITKNEIYCSNINNESYADHIKSKENHMETDETIANHMKSCKTM